MRFTTYVITIQIYVHIICFSCVYAISPVQSLFELFIEDPGKNLFGEMIRTYQKKRAGQTDITSFFNSSSNNNTLEVKKPVVLPTASAVAKTKKKADKEVSDSKQRKLTMFI